MTDLLTVRRVLLPRELADATRDSLRVAGEQGCEGMALWAGVQDGERFDIHAMIVPEQKAARGSGGLLVAVGADELFRLNRWLFEHRLRLIAQIHSHPTEAYHSETDDAFPIMAQAGGFSLVLPDFAARGFDLEDVAVYRLSEDRGWVLQTRDEVLRTFIITEV
ncbi:Mov34/MPN/PAD-1 family protein [Longimicrobium sp.]|uniref:Mov34/MPN/PAD-1 family protein n=1 Tax=Longimicrobium sp. TaxID=2029185 RepID=UPI002BB54F9B|nr:Mov34/MPN/PAD-1 family protein [Longimicrobium sp.]HSU13516.1 Mov34/MPN/PAD-1 family protein [Longimicrobium sp.]